MNDILHRIFRKLFPPSPSKMEKVLLKYTNSNSYPKVLSIDQTIELIKRNKMSLSRFGDGEFSLCFNKSIKFQKADKLLKLKLREILMSNSKNCLITIPEFTLKTFTPFGKQYWFENFKKIIKILHFHYTYGNTGITRQSNVEQLMMFSEIWENRTVILIVGKNSRFEIIPELFNNMKEHYFIYAPPLNAWESYNDILEEAKKYIFSKQNALFLISLGPTATVLAYDISLLGAQALDIGHLTSYYNAIQKKGCVPEDLPPVKN